ncbi:MAG: protein kinase [bacterium]|nr:protein kinase [bacterium]
MSNDTILNGRYRLVAQQGSGGMAVIYKAVDLALQRTVAVKILRPSLMTDQSFIVRFQNEARSIANLSHPNIVTVHDVGNEGQTHYIVMEFIEGQDLKKIIRAQGALSVERALQYAISICAGIGFAHRAGIVHADVKPQNILINKDDVVKITDFGIAQALSDTQPTQRASVVWGSPHYFAPEQAQGEKPTAAADVYAIGIVMFEMLTGRLPFTGANQQELALAHIRDRIPLVTEFNPSVPESLAKIVQRAMSKEPNDRYRMADQLGHTLIAYRDQGRQTTAQTPQVEDRPASAPRPAAQPAAPASAPSQPQQQPVGPTVQRPAVTPPPPAVNRPSVPPVPGIAPNAPPPEAMPTQRYSIAPNAPGQSNYARPAGPSVPAPAPPPAQGDSRPFQPQNPASPSAMRYPQQAGDSGPYAPRQPLARPQDDDIGSVLDPVTIALAVLAFMAVACLIPLYIAVLQARLG